MSSRPPARRASQSRDKVARLVVEFTARPGRDTISARECRRVLSAAAAELGVAAGRLSVLLTGDAEMAAINGAMRGRMETTDVLSFPAGEPLPAPGSDRHLGDIVVSVETASRQAGGAPVGREVLILLFHGLLHLLGYDHESDRGEMMRLQAALVRDLLPGRAPRR